MRILVAPDKFRGTLSAAQAAAAIGAGLRRGGPRGAPRCPLADGGEGTLDVLGGANRTTMVSDPLGDPVEARLAAVGADVAMIEMARASGLVLVGGAEGNDAVAASTYGTGELISAAVEAGASEVIVGVGGSATTDGGLGALRALYPVHRLRGVGMTVACDVRTGFVDAARVFAPQKGATEAQVELLHRRLERLADVYAEEYGVDVTASWRAPGPPAGSPAAWRASARSSSPGSTWWPSGSASTRLSRSVDAVVTGEGFLDDESFDGKVVGGVLDAAAHLGVPVVAVVGECFDGAATRLPTVSLVEAFGADAAIGDAGGCLFDAADLVGDRLATEPMDRPAGGAPGRQVRRRWPPAGAARGTRPPRPSAAARRCPPR